MTQTTLTLEQMARFALLGDDCVFYRNTTLKGIESFCEKSNPLMADEGDGIERGYLEVITPRICHTFVYIGKGKYEWWKCY